MRLFTPSQYQLLSTNSLSESQSPSPYPGVEKPTTTGRRIALSIILGAIILATTISILTYNPWTPTQTRVVAFTPCGKTPEEARAAGCKFDVMMDSWLSEDCYDEELTEEFRGLKDWPFYTDKNRTQQLSEEELSQRSIAHTTLEYHIAHCSFALRKLHRAIVQGRLIEEDVAAQGHTKHCAEYLRIMIVRLERSNLHKGQNFSVEDMGTTLNIAYPKCINAREIGL